MSYKKQQPIISEELRKELLTKILPDGYLETREELPFHFYLGLSGLIPIKVSFTPFSVAVDQLGRRPYKYTMTSRAINEEILCSIFQKDFFDMRAMKKMRYNDTLEVSIEPNTFTCYGFNF